MYKSKDIFSKFLWSLLMFLIGMAVVLFSQENEDLKRYATGPFGDSKVTFKQVGVPSYMRVGNGDSQFLTYEEVEFCSWQVLEATYKLSIRDFTTKKEALSLVKELEGYGVSIHSDGRYEDHSIRRLMRIEMIDMIWQGERTGSFMIETRGGRVQGYYVSLLFNGCLDKLRSL